MVLFVEMESGEIKEVVDEKSSPNLDYFTVFLDSGLGSSFKLNTR